MLRRAGNRRRFNLDGVPFDVERHRLEPAGNYSVRHEEKEHRVRVLEAGPGRGLVLVDNRVLRVAFRGGRVLVVRGGRSRSAPLEFRPATKPRPGAVASSGELRAPMPGRVLAVQAGVGEKVEPGDPLVLIEAMKMQNQLFAASAGVICSVLVQPGMVVERGALLVRIE